MHPGREANAGNARTTVTARNIYVPESATNPPSIRRRPDRLDGVFCYDERRFYGIPGMERLMLSPDIRKKHV